MIRVIIQSSHVIIPVNGVMVSTGASIRPKDTLLMRLLGVVPGFSGRWTTLGDTIYYPRFINEPQQYGAVIAHELAHVRQYRRWTVPLFLFLYLFVPLPIGLAYFRWRFEREAYLVEVQNGLSVDDAVHLVSGGGYLWCWPRPLVRRWFEKNAGDPDRLAPSSDPGPSGGPAV